MNCPHCDHPESRVSETRPTPTHDRRIRMCRSCGRSFQTIERVAVHAGRAIGYIEAPIALVAEEPEVEEPAPAVAAAKGQFHPVVVGEELLTVCEQVRPLMVEWWDNSRRSKHKGNAAWTRAAWLGAVKRVSQLPQWKQVLLVQAGVESGWQTLKPEYIKDTPAPATGGLAPKSTAMQEAIERWHQQPA